ncbi:hypothetical protein SB766_26330, partial [Pseudomonas sp. SIMBA_077]
AGLGFDFFHQRHYLAAVLLEVIEGDIPLRPGLGRRDAPFLMTDKNFCVQLRYVRGTSQQ